MDDQDRRVSTETLEREPSEVLASRLIDAWCADKGTKIPWAKAVQIAAIVTKQSDEERDKLLHIGDDDGSCEMCGRNAIDLERRLIETRASFDAAVTRLGEVSNALGSTETALDVERSRAKDVNQRLAEIEAAAQLPKLDTGLEDWDIAIYAEQLRAHALHLAAENLRLIKATHVSIPTPAMEQEFQNYYRRGRDSAKDEMKLLRMAADVGQSIQRAAAELPEGFEIGIMVENGAATVSLYDQDGDTLDVDDVDSDNRLAAEINAAIDAARSAIS